MQTIGKDFIDEILLQLILAQITSHLSECLYNNGVYDQLKAETMAYNGEGPAPNQNYSYPWKIPWVTYVRILA